jgi:methylamine dehydrogenase accessory protein MauD
MELFWTAGIIALGALNAFMLIALLAFAREIGIILVRLGPAVPKVLNEGPKTGAAIGTIDLRRLDGTKHVVAATKLEWKLLMFVSPACRSCVEIAGALKTFATHYRDRVRVYAISSGQPSPEDAVLAESLGPRVIYSRNAEVGSQLQIPATPYAVLLDENNIVVSVGITNSLEQLEALLAIQLQVLARASRSELMEERGHFSVMEGRLE